MYLLAKEVTSLYCFTEGLQYFAQNCVKIPSYKDTRNILNNKFWLDCSVFI